MPLMTDTFDLGGLRLRSGEGRRLDLSVTIDPLQLSEERYEVELAGPVRLDVSRMTGGASALRLRLGATLTGACMRCLKPAQGFYEVDAREFSLPGEGEELE